ncbi:class I SAM-dependent methyltransferase [Mycobacterium sp. MYCO198283]|uniref:class I SAM-dependent methyltransferase n=1 Tax=Mycobacterium sp. MYCO198283 TaxID=2883505 RepID=UPI001E61CE22|nr:class I SAM-dependent methyltransferase [Mycobacterium sp. MYCO198283]MCG5430819.1 class I SAM-dependent methyltransferase [Mycobacterium sp. MYCO198283]
MDTEDTEKIRAALTGVSETALLTLQVRATEARRPDGIIDDPQAVALLDAIEHDFGKFGPAHRQDMALRALAFDAQVRRYLGAHPRATVVALAEGFQTSFWRLDDGRVGHEFRWLTVDLPPVIELRQALLPPSDRIAVRAQSALDFSWMDDVAVDDGVFVTAEGLLMYLQPQESMAIITECAKRFPGGAMMFDLPPQWFAALARAGLMRTSLRYRVPPMPFSLTPKQLAGLVDSVPGVRAVHDLPIPQGRGRLLNTLAWTAQRLPLFDPLRPMFALLEFG